jgi:hypothetical protein
MNALDRSDVQTAQKAKTPEQRWLTWLPQLTAAITIFLDRLSGVLDPTPNLKVAASQTALWKGVLMVLLASLMVTLQAPRADNKVLQVSTDLRSRMKRPQFTKEERRQISLAWLTFALIFGWSVWVQSSTLEPAKSPFRFDFHSTARAKGGDVKADESILYTLRLLGPYPRYILDPYTPGFVRPWKRAQIVALLNRTGLESPSTNGLLQFPKAISTYPSSRFESQGADGLNMSVICVERSR